MQKYFLSILFITGIVIQALSQEDTVRITIIKQDVVFQDTNDLGFYFVCKSIDCEYNNGSVNGKLRKYKTSDSVLVNIIEMKNGLRNGEAIEFFWDSTISVKTQFVEDKLEGDVVSYYYGGQKLKEYSFKNGELDGVYVYYFESGDTLKMETYLNGLLDGTSRSFWKKNKVRSEDIYKEGVVIKRTIYRRNGKIKYEEVFDLP